MIALDSARLERYIIGAIVARELFGQGGLPHKVGRFVTRRMAEYVSAALKGAVFLESHGAAMNSKNLATVTMMVM